MATKQLHSAPLLLAAIAWLSVGMLACARKDYGNLKQNQSSRTQQQVFADLHAPVRAGHQLLSKVLPQAKARISIFELNAGSAKHIKRGIRQADLWNERLAIFFETPRHGQSDQYDLFYFDPRAMRIQKLADNDDHIHHIVRSVPVSRKPTFTQNELDVFLFSFQRKQAIRLKRSERLSNHLGNNIMPIAMPDKNLVLYTSVDAENKKRIMSVPLKLESGEKREATALIAHQHIQSSHPRILSDGSLGIIANPEGYFRAYEFDLEHRLYTPTSKRAAGADNGDILIQSAASNDSVIILDIPETLDLKSLMALVQAQNTSVNRYRALLAASLIEARRGKLGVLPTLNFGVYYTPVTNIANGNTIASGDFLAEGISRGLFGIVQDLLAIPRNLAINEAQIVRAEIARDNLLNEVNQRQAELADLFFQAQLYQQLIDIDKTLLGHC